MKYMDKSISALHEMLMNKEVTSEQLVEESLSLSHELQEKCNAFVTILDDAKPQMVLKIIIPPRVYYQLDHQTP